MSGRPGIFIHTRRCRRGRQSSICRDLIMNQSNKTIERPIKETPKTDSEPTAESTSAGSAGFPTVRMRRLRYHPLVRNLVRETRLSIDDLILPLFVRPGRGVKKEIPSMLGNYQLSVDRLVEEVGQAVELGLKTFILFGIP